VIDRAIPDYANLDLNGEARRAAARMEARAREPASETLYQELVRPLLAPPPRRVLELGCGTAPLARRLARDLPGAAIRATDKSAGMLAAAGAHVVAEGCANVSLAAWDVLDDRAFPFGEERYDLVVSSVMMPYVDDADAPALLARLAARLAAGGRLAFLERELMSVAVNYPSMDLFWRVYAKPERVRPRGLVALTFRPLLRAAGLDVLPRRSFLWTDDRYGEYAHDVLGRMADGALDAGRISAAERAEWSATLDALAAAGDFFWGAVYHLVAGVRAADPA
jgi:SAM-dependent methyltransferase